MIVDTSALVAILRAEEDADLYIDALAGEAEPLLCAATFLEAAIVIDANRDPVLSRKFDDLLAASRVRIEPLTAAHAEIARQAYRDFGKGSGHPAGLNLGDCFSYALARSTGRPLLFKGDDFTYTDVVAALAP